MDKLRVSLIKNAIANQPVDKVSAEGIAFLAIEAKTDEAFVKAALDELGVAY